MFTTRRLPRHEQCLAHVQAGPAAGLRLRAARTPVCRAEAVPESPPTRLRCSRSEEHTSELQSHLNLVCRLLLEKKKRNPQRVALEKTRRIRRRVAATANPSSRVPSAVALPPH